MTNKSKKPYGETLVRVLSQHSTLLAFLALCIAIAVISPGFLTAGNILNVLRQISINGIIAVGMTLVVITGGIDLSVGAIVALAAVSACQFAHSGAYPLMVPLVCGLVVGAACGMLNGVLISYGRIAPFIVTLGMMTAARGLAFVVTGGRPVIDLSSGYNQIGGGYLAGLPLPVVILALVSLLGYFLLTFTRFGRYVYAIGGNEKAAVVSAIDPARSGSFVGGDGGGSGQRTQGCPYELYSVSIGDADKPDAIHEVNDVQP